ncbi:MAG: hypothetical protein J6S85_10490 [Methanobrevibacter sp.]|nr:hypothetical protein [Methanobrevibacter sp.]
MFYKKKKLINKMKKLNLTYKDLADLTGYCYGHIAHAMNGDYQMSTRMRNKILKALNELNPTEDVKVVEVKDELVDKEKKYLTTVEEVTALKDTDTIIYMNNSDKTFKFVNGVLCSFDHGTIFVSDYLGINNRDKYILVDKPIAEATEEDIGKVCKFWDETEDSDNFGLLEEIYGKGECVYAYKKVLGSSYKHCRVVTPKEVKQLTGYEVKGK